MLRKIELMLQIYREKLEKANLPPIDYVEGIRLTAKIDVLESLYYYALREGGQETKNEQE